MEGFDVEKFIGDATIIREKLPENIIQDDCEYEVTKKAMDLYKLYPCYKKEWETILHGNSIANYIYEPNQKHRKMYRGIKKYVGAHLLKEIDGDEKVLTADILTSITSPINYLLTVKLVKNSNDYHNKKRSENIAGEDIVNIINQSCKNKDKEISFKAITGDNMCRLKGDIVPYIYAFAYVYHWCGNMMPVIWNPGAGNRDTIIYKVEKIKEFFEKTQEVEGDLKELKEKIITRKGRTYIELWKLWINLYWKKKTISDFINNNYLVDVISIKRENFNDIKIDSQWFMINTKLIVQRSYRILFDVQDKFNLEQIKNIQDIFQYIFSETQIPEGKRDLELI